LFVILQQNSDTVKLENDDDLSEKDAIDMQTGNVYTPSAFSISEAERKVSLVCRRILLCLFL
jgi:hypothetical protein